jgi:muramoyltetrapeptide carboxypeptidase
MPRVFAGCGEKYYSASLEKRLKDLHACWLDDSIDMVICVRGGVGSAELLPYLDWALLASRPLPLLGMSDITALHMGMFVKGAGIPLNSCVAKNLPGFVSDEFSTKYLKRAFFAEFENKEIVLPLPLRIIQPGTARGQALFANLTVLASLCGTPWFPGLEGRILFLEDVNEPAYKISRCLWQLDRAGELGSLAGLVFCSFDNCAEASELELIFKRFAGKTRGPVLAGFPFGHSFPTFSAVQGREMAIIDGLVYD